MAGHHLSVKYIPLIWQPGLAKEEELVCMVDAVTVFNMKNKSDQMVTFMLGDDEFTELYLNLDWKAMAKELTKGAKDKPQIRTFGSTFLNPFECASLFQITVFQNMLGPSTRSPSML